MRRTAAAAVLSLLTLSLVVAGPAPDAAAWPSADWSSDFDGDGAADVVVDDFQGRLWLYPGTGTGRFEPRRQLGSGWQERDEIRPVGDWNGDGFTDLVARDARGQLWFYTGAGSTGFAGGGVVGRGWHLFREILGVGDWTGDGNPDLVAVRRDTGALVLYPGDGERGLLASRTIGRGWHSRDALTSTGDWDLDGDADFLARDTASGNLLLYAGDGVGGFQSITSIGRGWQGFTALVGVGDFTGDTVSDVLARTRAGELVLYPRDGSRQFLPPRVVGRGWNGFDLNAPGVMVAPAGTAAAALAVLRVRAQNRSGFTASAFRHWVDANGDCQDTKAEVLIEEAIGHYEFRDIHRRCELFYTNHRGWTDGAQISSDYSGSAVVRPTVQHAEAWGSGARTWTAARRQVFANDLGYVHTLAVMSSDAAAERGVKDPTHWIPPDPRFQCSYAARWVAVKHRWGLSVDPAERSALSDVLDESCGLSRLSLPPRR